MDICNPLKIVCMDFFFLTETRDQDDLVKIDTDRLYPILILSRIEKSVLAKLWSLVNRAIPGQLVKHELYMMLALVALTQVRC
jgi:hypothetical protein